MNKTKVYIDWDYAVNAESHHNWESTALEECDVIVSINRNNDFKKVAKKVLWLLEPEAIEPELYSLVQNQKMNYDFIASHRAHLSQHNENITIYPCTPSWISKDDRKVYEKNKNISMIASTKIMCAGHAHRQQIAKKVSNCVDLYGHGRKNKLDYKLDGLKDYRFSIAMENSVADLYFTEKVLDCFFTGTIPIYWGTQQILNIFNPKGIIMLEDFLDKIDSFDYEKEYQERYDAVIENIKIASTVNLHSADGIQQIISKMAL